MLRAGIAELRRAFRLHYEQAASGTTESHNLLLFYAAECGMKAVWLRRNHRMSSDDFPTSFRGRDGHDLGMWMKELRIGARISPPPGLRLQRDNTSLHVSEVHEAWRYGIRVRPRDETQLRCWLNSLCQWVEEAIQQ